MCGFCDVWVCVCVGVCMCGFCDVCVCMCGFCNVWVCVCEGFVMCVCVGFVMLGCGFCNVCVGFVMCGCLGTMCTCIYCVLYRLNCVFLLFRLCIFILICFICTTVRTTATE